MAIIKNVDADVSEVERGQAYAGSGYPVDAAQTSGLEIAQLFTLKPDGTSVKYDNATDAGATAILADNTDETKLPVGIVYKSSDKNPYNGRDITEQRYLFPVNVERESGSLQPVKELLVREMDSTDNRAATRKTLAVTLTGTWSVVTGTSDTTVTEDETSGAASTELTAGDWVIIDGKVKQVASVTDDDNFEVTKAFTADITSVSVTRDIDLEKPVYLSTVGDYTMLKPQSGAVIVVGRVVGPNEVLIKINDKNKYDELN